MFELAVLLAGAAATAGAIGLCGGFYLGRRTKIVRDLRFVCQCKHNKSEHCQSGECGHRYDFWKGCPCLHYLAQLGDD